MVQEISSFRDKNSRVFDNDGHILRYMSMSALVDYKLLMYSGLGSELWDKRLLIKHYEVDDNTIYPETIPCIAYPYEWCFSQLKDAALLTLEIQEIALEYRMSLKDASAYNVQFIGCKPIFIDTTSFERYQEGKPWVAYGQFCRHFLAPLSLMAYTDIRLNKLMQLYIDGIPLDLTSKLLPLPSKFSELGVHIHLHSKMVGSVDNNRKVEGKISYNQLKGIIQSLRRAVSALKPKDTKTIWGNYDREHYTGEAFNDKVKFVVDVAKEINPNRVIDFGANNGLITRLIESKYKVALDMDINCVEHLYKSGEVNILPLVCDLTVPSPSIGWDNKERSSLKQRYQADLCLALALVHHLAIGNNVPLGMIAQMFAEYGEYLVVEFVPKHDMKVRMMLANRGDIFTDYTQQGFEREFSKVFDIINKHEIVESDRVMYFMKRKPVSE
jgi:hypothetical protein